MTLLLVVPLLEVVVIIAVGRAIGGWPTFFLLLAESMFGAWLVRHEGARAWSSLQEALTTGTMPSRQLSDAALVMVGGVLLLAPGFITDIVGVLPRSAVHPATGSRTARGGRRPPAARRCVCAGCVSAGWHGVVRLRPRTARSRTAGPGQGPNPTSRSAASDDVIEGEVL